MKKNQNQIIALRDSLFLIKSIEQRILWIRNQKVILDADLAEMFGISTKRFNEQVKRNLGRFPEDFLFTLSMREKQEVVAFCDHLHKLKFSAALPKAFTEHGVIMAANCLNSQRAIDMSIYIVRAFIRMRDVIGGHSELWDEVKKLQKKVGVHDQEIQDIVLKIQDMMGSPDKKSKKQKIGFRLE